VAVTLCAGVLPYVLNGAFRAAQDNGAPAV